MAETRPLRIGFVATRFAGTDGVSLEAEKWAVELRAMGHDVYYFAGLVDRPPEKSREVPEAFFGHPDVAAISEAVFGDASSGRPDWVSRSIDELTAHLKAALYDYVRDLELDMLLPENALTIPMHLPLGLAITQLAAETGIPVLAHHHDFAWERQRFLVNSATDLISAAFPPALPNVRHACINTTQREAVARRLGRTARVIPNVMDFENPPATPDAVTAGLRADLGLAEDELFVLAPVRVVPRKGLEHAVELVARLDRPARFVVSHAAATRAWSTRRASASSPACWTWTCSGPRSGWPTSSAARDAEGRPAATRWATCTTPATWWPTPRSSRASAMRIWRRSTTGCPCS